MTKRTSNLILTITIIAVLLLSITAIFYNINTDGPLAGVLQIMAIFIVTIGGITIILSVVAIYNDNEYPTH